MPDTAGTPVFSIQVERLPDHVALVRCRGPLVTGYTEILTSGVRPLFPDCRRVVLDLSGLNHINSQGMGALINLHVDAKAAGSSLELTDLSPYIRNVLRVVKLLDFFTVTDENRASG